MIVLCLFCFCCLLFTEGNLIEDRVSNGTVCKEHEYPFMVGIMAYDVNTAKLCGGSLIAPDWVLTAAHCVNLDKIVISRVFLRMGSNYIDKNGTVTIAVHGIMHPKYVVNVFKYDFGLLKPRKPFKLNANIQLVRFPTEANFYTTCKFLSILGWGDLFENIHSVTAEGSAQLQCAIEEQVPLTAPNCQLWNFDADGNIKEVLDDNFIFAAVRQNQKGICRGDSGGPILCKGLQVANVAAISKTCGSVDSCSIFGNVEKNFDFITNHTGIPSPFKKKQAVEKKPLEIKKPRNKTISTNNKTIDTNGSYIERPDWSKATRKQERVQMFVPIFASFIALLNLL